MASGDQLVTMTVEALITGAVEATGGRFARLSTSPIVSLSHLLFERRVIILRHFRLNSVLGKQLTTSRRRGM
jgi:hypothetical protein